MRLWRQRFGGDAAAVGRSITLNGIPHRVVGVLPPDVAFRTANRALPAARLQAPNEPPSPLSQQFMVYARLKPGVTMAQALPEMDRIGKDLEAAVSANEPRSRRHVTSLPEEITGPVERTLVVLMAAVGFILLIACINSDQPAAREGGGTPPRDAVRAAIGAAAHRLIRQVLVECSVMALAGGAAGLAPGGGSVQTAGGPIAGGGASGFGRDLSACGDVVHLRRVRADWHAPAPCPRGKLVREDPAEPLKGRWPQSVSLKRGLRLV